MFSLPLLGGNLLQSLNATANQFWVAHLLGTTDITAIGNANSVMFLSLSAIMGATMAANILIAQQVGAGRPDRWSSGSWGTVDLLLRGRLDDAVASPAGSSRR